MALTKVTKSGITDNSIDADKIEDGTIVAADIADGTITAAKLDSTLNLSTKTVTLPNTSVTSAMLAGSIANDKLANSSITVNGSSVSLGGSVSAGSIEWQTVKTSGFTAVAGEGYFCNTNGSAFTATLPASPSAGDTVAFKDYGDDFATNALTIARNGKNIQGVANDSQISTDRASVVCVFIDDTKGWLFTNESNVADLQEVLFVTATGGTVATSGNFKIHSFTGDGCFVVSSAGNSVGSDKVDYLVIAGGAGGGGCMGGGGGAGGYRESPGTASGSYTVSPLGAAPAVALPVPATTYPITVGSGGSGGGPGSEGSDGTVSTFSTITSAGGGGGGGRGPGGTGSAAAGGSGGGQRAGFNPGFGPVGGTGNTPPVSPPQGNTGGKGFDGLVITTNGGGGGGAGAVGSDSLPTPSPNGGPGGNGVSTSITGSSVTRAGGGGGGSDSGGDGSGGSGGGGASLAPTGNAGTVNTGSGGGGGSAPGNSGGAGGSGIVIIRYKFQ